MLYRVYTAVHKIRKRKERRDPNDGCQKSQEETDGGQLSVVSGANAVPVLRIGNTAADYGHRVFLYGLERYCRERSLRGA